jgi:hypothetical protein
MTKAFPRYRDTLLIGLVGPQRAGKSTIANHLARHYGFEHMSLSSTLKQMAMCLGLSDEHVNGSLREIPSELICNRTPRFVLQRIGDDFRMSVGEDLWTRITEQAIQTFEEECGTTGAECLIVVDDVRHHHQAAMILRNGGYLVRVDGRGVIPGRANLAFSRSLVGRAILHLFGSVPVHTSERHWQDISTDFVLLNDGDVFGLMDTVSAIVQPLMDERGLGGEGAQA